MNMDMIIMSQQSTLLFFVLSLTLVFVAYALVVAFVRRFMSPLAQFPGPILAALTYYYEAYYDLLHGGGGHFTFHVKKLHEQYSALPSNMALESISDSFQDPSYALTQPRCI